MSPFSNVRVLDLSWVVAGPAVGRVLADYGAQVIRVESTSQLDAARLIGPFHGGERGPEQSVLYGDVNAGKLGITLDLKRPEAQQIVRELAAVSDVVVESFAPGRLAGWQLGYDDLRAVNPGLVMLSTSLLGQTGRYSRIAGYGNVGSAFSGFQALVGWPDRAPYGPYGPYSDYVAPRFALADLLAALDHRRRTGEGCYLDVSQVEAAIQFLAPQVAAYSREGQVAERHGNADPGMAPHGVYPCSEPDSWVAIAVESDAQWGALAELLGVTDEVLATSAGRTARAAELDRVVTAWTSVRPVHDVEALLQERGIPVHRCLSSMDIVDDPQFAHRGHFVQLTHPLHGTTTVHSTRFHLSATPAVTRAAAPLLGEHTRTVLRDVLGYTDERIDGLADAGVLT